MTTARALSDNLATLLRREHDALAEFLVALADFDRRRCWVELGHSSLFWFLHRELGLSKGAAFYRKTAAELVQRFPEIVEPLRDGRLCLTSIFALAKVLTPENRDEVIPRFFHRSRIEAMEVVAELAPVEAPPRRAVVTAVRATAPAAGELSMSTSAARDTRAPEQTETSSAGWPANLVDANTPRADAQAPTSRENHERVEPLSADLRRLHVTVSRRLLEKLAAAHDALSHARPDASTEEILEAGLDLLLADCAKRKGLAAKPRKERRPAKDDHVPAEVKRTVWTRDQGKCQWPLRSGGVCGSTRKLQLDHRRPKARGGPPTVENLRLLCAFHNQYAARLEYGDELMERYSGPGRKRRDGVA